MNSELNSCSEDLLTSLPSELVVEVASHLDTTSTLALASSSALLHNLVTQTAEWKKILGTIGRFKEIKDEDEEVDEGGPDKEHYYDDSDDFELSELTAFLETAAAPEPQLEEVLHLLCSKFPATNQFTSDQIRCRCPPAGPGDHRCGRRPTVFFPIVKTPHLRLQ